MLQLRVSVPTLARRALRPVSTSCSFMTRDDKDRKQPDLDDDTYELLPPGASMKDPLYDLGSDEQVYIYDRKPVEVRKPKGSRGAPHNVEAARKELESKKGKGGGEDETYVYLPPGSSMREPGDSLSDPAYPKVYHRDPAPVPPKK